MQRPVVVNAEVSGPQGEWHKGRRHGAGLHTAADGTKAPTKRWADDAD